MTPGKMPPVIGVTGSIGSGKSAVAALFSEWGAAVISADQIGRDAIESSATLRRRLAASFGRDILASGILDRALLARRAFALPESVLRLNQMVHPPLIRALNQRVDELRRSRPVAVVIDAALLVEWGAGRIHWDRLIGVWAPRRLRYQRLRTRGVTEAQIVAFEQAQAPWTVKRALCDFIVKNDASRRELRSRARHCWEKLLLSPKVEPGRETPLKTRERRPS
jgi:dephospho-CoA kinase